MRNPFSEASCRDFTVHFCIAKRLVHLEQLDEQCRDALVALEVNKHRVKVQYDNSIHSMRFSEGDLVLLWDQDKEPLVVVNFNTMWHGPYVVKRVLEKGAYELVDYEGTALVELRNGLYLKNYYAWSLARADFCILLYILHCIVRFSYGDLVC